jgi:hypothetical protein
MQDAYTKIVKNINHIKLNHSFLTDIAELHMGFLSGFRVGHIWNATQQQSRTAVQKWNQNQVHPGVMDSLNLPRGIQFEVTFVARPLLTPVAQSCAGANMVYSRAEFTFSLYFVFQQVFDKVTLLGCTCQIYFFFFVHPMPYSIPSFLNVTLLHCNVFTKAVYNETSNWSLVC